jgi:hypothetical protein
MGELLSFQRSGGCTRWQLGGASINLSARPACAALARAFAAGPSPDTGHGLGRTQQPCLD